jgi:hypothetical protein
LIFGGLAENGQRSGDKAASGKLYVCELVHGRVSAED